MESPLPSPPPTGTARCQTAQLELAFLSATGAAGHTVAEFQFRNKALVPCYLYGYVGMQLLDGSGTALETHVVRDPAGTPTTVTLPPGSPALGNGPSGHGRFLAEWVSNCDVTGAHFNPEIPASIAIIPPDETTPLTISARSLNGSSISVCPGQELPGSIHTKPVEAAT